MRVLSMDTKNQVIAVGFTPGRPLLVAVTELSRVSVWDLSSNEDPLSFPSGIALSGPLRFSRDGRRIITSDGQNRFGLDLQTLHLEESKLHLDAELRAFAQTPDERRMVTAHDKPFRFVGWRRRAGQWVEDWTVEPGPDAFAAQVIAMDPTGDRFAHWCRVRGIRGHEIRLAIRSATTGVELERGEYPATNAELLEFRPDGSQVIALDRSTIFIWPVPGVGTPHTVDNDSRKHFTAAAFHPSSRCLFTTSNDATVVVWDVTTWKTLTRFTWDVGRLRSVAVSPDGMLAAAGSDRGRVVVWDVDL